MKKLPKAETICLKLALFFLLQISLLFLFRTSVAPIPLIQDHKKWRPKLGSSSSPSISLLSTKHDDLGTFPPFNTFPSYKHKPLPNPIKCDRSNRLYDWCRLSLPSLLDPSTATFHTFTPSETTRLPVVTEKLKPYPRKTDASIMSKITEITLTTSSPRPTSPQCQIRHQTPALAFSIGGFTGNFFHDFNDGFIPLFVTLNTLFPDQDVTLVITNYDEWWFEKYEAIISEISKQPIINLDNQTVTHCFPSSASGLITHGPMTVRPDKIPNRKTFLAFRALLEAGYKKCPAWPAPKVKGKPRLVVVSRTGSVGRVMVNQDAVIKAAQEEGFEVFVLEPTPDTYLCQIYRLINSSHVVVGVHGAALTHALFLPPRAVLIQIVPLGNDWLAETYFGRLARGMRLEYVEYKVRAEESTLVEKYGAGHAVVKDAVDVASRNWSALHSVYLKGQDVRVDVRRFRGFLRRGFEKGRRLMVEQGLRVKRRAKIRTYVKPVVYNYN